MKPLDLRVLFEDEHILACYKPPQIATQSCSIRTPDIVSLAKNYLSGHPVTHAPYRGGQASSDKVYPSGHPVMHAPYRGGRTSSDKVYLGIIHRLDQPVSGILVFAKTPFAAKLLSAQLADGGFGKYYRALVENAPNAPSGIVANYLVRDGRTNTSRICTQDTPGAKYASLKYTTVKKGHELFSPQQNRTDSSQSRAELDICLDTGRHHQIRVQLTGLGCPIVGDTKYNPNAARQGGKQTLCLCAYKLEFAHPKTNERLHFELGTG